MIYIGLIKGRAYPYFKKFYSDTEPTEKTHGSEYLYVIGPFDTEKGADWACQYGGNNPHFQCVEDAERISHDMQR